MPWKLFYFRQDVKGLSLHCGVQPRARFIDNKYNPTAANLALAERPHVHSDVTLLNSAPGAIDAELNHWNGASVEGLVEGPAWPV